MATPDTDIDASDTAEASGETRRPDDTAAPGETRSFAPDLFGHAYDAAEAEGGNGLDDDDLDDEEDEDLEDDADETEGSGASAEDVEDESHPRQEELLDEGIEESFPASDPVSVKRIT